MPNFILEDMKRAVEDGARVLITSVQIVAKYGRIEEEDEDVLAIPEKRVVLNDNPNDIRDFLNGN